MLVGLSDSILAHAEWARLQMPIPSPHWVDGWGLACCLSSLQLRLTSEEQRAHSPKSGLLKGCVKTAFF